MISRSDFESITDRIGKQVEGIRELFGVIVSETPVASLTVCDSLFECNDDVVNSGDKQSLNKLIGHFDYLQGYCDFNNILQTIYDSRILSINTFLVDGSEVAYSGYSKFSINTGMRYCSEFCRLIKLSGLTLSSSYFGFYDQADVLGEFVVGGANTGTWTAANNPFTGIDVNSIYGLQPSSGMEVIATSIIGADTEIRINATTITGSVVNLSANLSNLDAIGTTDKFTSATGFDDYLVSINSVSIVGGNATDTFNIRFKPLRTIAL